MDFKKVQQIEDELNQKYWDLLEERWADIIVELDWNNLHCYLDFKNGPAIYLPYVGDIENILNYNRDRWTHH